MIRLRRLLSEGAEENLLGDAFYEGRIGVALMDKSHATAEKLESQGLLKRVKGKSPYHDVFEITAKGRSAYKKMMASWGNDSTQVHPKTEARDPMSGDEYYDIKEIHEIIFEMLKKGPMTSRDIFSHLDRESQEKTGPTEIDHECRNLVHAKFLKKVGDKYELAPKDDEDFDDDMPF